MLSNQLAGKPITCCSSYSPRPRPGPEPTLKPRNRFPSSGLLVTVSLRRALGGWLLVSLCAFHGLHHGDLRPERMVRTYEFDNLPGPVYLETVTLEDLGGSTLLLAPDDIPAGPWRERTGAHPARSARHQPAAHLSPGARPAACPAGLPRGLAVPVQGPLR